MINVLLLAILFLSLALTITYILKRRAEGKVSAAQLEAEHAREERDIQIAQAQRVAESSIANAQAQYEQKASDLDAEAEKIREHYEQAAQKLVDEANQRAAELEPLRIFSTLQDAEGSVRKTLEEAVAEASALREEGARLLEQTRASAVQERLQAQTRVKEINEQAQALLNQATKDAGRIVAEAENRAEKTAGAAYDALRDKQLLEQAVAAMRNIIDGYGDRYVYPTQSLLDDLAVEFGYDAAGQSLGNARAQSRRMVEQGEAATCDYVEAYRRQIAIRFVIDAFNGRVDAILSRVKHDNYGTLEQQIRDAFSLVNLNGEAFRNARILPSYLDGRLAELKWASVVQELALKQREEQRYLKERMRDEEKARREYAAKLREAAREEELKRQALEEAERKFANATADQKAHYEGMLNNLRAELTAASQRALTIAQQTKKGHVYVLSNIGSFGEGIYKIGQTRRPDPQDRVDELGDASVPFEFDVHALIESENAPALEHKIHKQLLSTQVNKINSRKEFFRVPLQMIHQEIEKLESGEDFLLKVWTELATATEYKESLEIESDPAKKEKWLARQKALADRQISLDKLRVIASPIPEAEENGGDDNSEDAN